MKATTVAGGSPDNPEAEETDTPAASPVPPETTPGAQSDAEAGARARDEVVAQAGADRVAAAKAEPGPRAKAGSEGSAEAGAESRNGPDAQAEPDTVAEDEAPPAGPGAARGKAGGPGAGHAQSEGPGAARASADPRNAGGARTPAAPEPMAAPRPVTGTAPEPEDAGDTRTPAAAPKTEIPDPRGAAPRPEPEAGPATGPEAESAPEGPGNAGKPSTATQANGKGAARSDTLRPNARADAEPEAAPRPEAGPDSEAAPESAANADRRAAARQPEAKTEGPAVSGTPGAKPAPTASGNTPKPPATPEPDAKTHPTAGPATPDADPEAAPGSDDLTMAVRRPATWPKAKPTPTASGNTPKPPTTPEPDAKTHPTAGPATPDADPDAAPGSDDLTMAVRRPATWPKAKPTPTASGNTPKPPTTPGPDGAGSSGVPEAEASSGRPGAGTRDAAEGSRRVPSWAQGQAGGSDSERTSKFVALKPLDAPAPAPAPASASAPAPAGAIRRPAPAAPSAEAPAPLGLLAELTNTAPPPETPRRSALRRVKIWTPILLLLVGGVAGAQLLRPLPAPEIVAAETGHTVAGQLSIPWPAKGQGAIRVPGSGDIGTFGEQKPVPTASVAKVMTAYVILKNHPLKKNDPGPSIKIDAKTVADGTSENESRIVGLTAGTEFSQQDMLKMLMIPSGNNVARLLARWDTGSDSEAAFVEKMNAAARELGMANTVYTDPSGLDAGTVSTATDQLKLAEAVMKDEVFRAIVALPNAPVEGLRQPLDNNNDLLNSSIRGIKTGSSTPAGGALMWAAYKSVGDETPLVLGTLMDQRVDGPDPNATKSLKLALDNSKKIIEAVRTALASAPVVRKGDTVGYVDDGLGGRTPLVAAKDLNVVGVPGQQLKLALKPGASPLPHTAKAGAEVAVLTAGDGEGARSVPVAVGKQLAEPSFGTRLTRLR
ncbi:serine hydrolase [Streptomyces sp. NPDC048270]|uniref:serine hydrolase n=1 Tax=Streptomyces sp. NPDC048270 TaxID=3154615 RepID=UPI00340DC3A1